jgi:hypothetical protein
MFVLASQRKAAVPQAPVSSSLVRVHVHTDEGGDAGDLEGRRESVKDLSKALAGNVKHLVVVDDEAAADVVLEVIDRGVTIPKVVIGVGARPGQPLGAGEALARAVHLRVKLTRGNEAVAFTNRNTALEQNLGWKSAADDIAKQVDRWIVDHSKQIVAPR